MGDVVEISITVGKDIDAVWKSWITPDHIRRWNFATEEWHCPSAVSDFVEKGSFSYRMEARDGSMGFDYSGIFTKIDPRSSIDLILDDDRKVSILFQEQDTGTVVTERFEADASAPRDIQEQGWKAILENFRSYTESAF